MSGLQLLIAETVDNVCKNFCKYSGTGNEEGCVYTQTHCGECPFTDLLKEVGEWHCTRENE